MLEPGLARQTSPSRDRREHPALEDGLLLGAAFVALWLAAERLTAPTDDAFISFRYARHLADGEGLVFNPGERVEGFSNLLWVLLLAAGHALGLDLPTLSRVLSSLCAALLVTSLVRFSACRPDDASPSGLRFVAAAMLACHPLFTVMNGSGLETTFFALLTWWTVACYFAPEERASDWRTGALLSLAYLARPEAAIWALCFLATDALEVLRGVAPARPRLMRAARYAGSFAGVVAIHLAWRWSYYGDLLPNTFYVKGGAHWSWGVGSLQSFLLGTGGLPALALLGVALRLRDRLPLCVGAIIAVYLLLVLRTGGSRYLYPLLPLVFLLLQELLRDTWRRAGRVAGALLAAALAALYLFGAARDWRIVTFSLQFNRHELENSHALATCLAATTGAHDLIAVVAAGQLPFELDRPILDMLGLNDRHIAKRGLRDPASLIWHHAADPDYVLDRRPRVIVMPDQPDAPILAVRGLLQSSRFRRDYRRTELACPGGPQTVFVRRDAPLPRQRVRRSRDRGVGARDRPRPDPPLRCEPPRPSMGAVATERDDPCSRTRRSCSPGPRARWRCRWRSRWRGSTA